jgi:hypothetical protein
MMPEQLPSIDADLGVQKDARLEVQNRLKHTRLDEDTIQNDLENLCYNTMMDGIRRGFNYGWRLAEKRMNERHGQEPRTAEGD